MKKLLPIIILSLIIPSIAFAGFWGDLWSYFSNDNLGEIVRIFTIKQGGTNTSSTPTDGQLLIGSGGTYSVNNLTAGSNITITNGSGTISIASTGGGGGGSTTTIAGLQPNTDIFFLTSTSGIDISTSSPATIRFNLGIATTTELAITSLNNGFLKVNSVGKITTSTISSADDVSFSAINTTTNMRHAFGDFASAGWISGGIITDAGSGNIDIATGEGFIRSSNSSEADIFYTTWSALSGQNIPSGATRYISVFYNAGSPIATSTASAPPNFNTYIYLGEVHNLAGTLIIHNDNRPVGDFINRIEQWSSDLIQTRVVSGEVVSDPSSPSQKIKITAGNYWDRYFLEYTDATVDTSGAGTFVPMYRNGAGDWTTETATTTWENTKWDDGDGTLATMTAAYFSNRWVIRGFNGNIYVLYGQAEFSDITGAQDETAPSSRPEFLDEHGFYVGKIIVLKSQTSPQEITQLAPVIGGGTDGTGGGISTLNSQTGSTQTFATGTATGIGLTVDSASNIHTLTPTVSSGYEIPTTASTSNWNSKENVLTFNSPFSRTVNTIDLIGRLATINSIATSTGSLIIGRNDATGWYGLVVGANGKVLTASSTATNGVSWETVAGGSGITSLNGQTGSSQTFATSSDTNIGLETGSAGDIHTLTSKWIGTLADSRIASANTWNAKITTTSLSMAYPPLAYNNTTGVFTLPTSTASQSGFLSSADWETFNGKQNQLWGLSGSNLFASSTSWNVGIGTTTPATTLSVIGTSRFGDASNYGSFDVDGDLTFTGTADYLVAGNDYAFRYSADEDVGMFFNSTNARYELRNTVGVADQFFGANGGVNYFANNVGIGTTTPAYKLDVWGDLRVNTSSTLGNVISGVWNGTAIGDSYISSAATWNAKQDALSFPLAYASTTHITATPPLLITAGDLSLTGRLSTINSIATTTGNLMVGKTDGTGWYAFPKGTDGLCLVASSTATYGLSYQSCASGGTGLSSLNGLTASTQTFSTSTANISSIKIVSSGSDHQFQLSSRLNTIGGLATTTGSLIVASGTDWTAKTVGANGTVMTASSTAAGGVNWENNIIWKSKTADESETGATVQSDNELFFPVLNGETWTFEFRLQVNNTNAATPDWKSVVLGASGWTCAVIQSGIEPAAAAFPQGATTDCDNVPATLSNGTIAADGNIPFQVYIQGWITATSNGNVQLQWSPFNTGGTITVKKGSYVIAKKQ